MSSHHYLFEAEEEEEKRLLQIEKKKLARVGSQGGIQRRRNSFSLVRSNDDYSQRSFTGLQEESDDVEEKELSSPQALLDSHTVKNPLTALRITSKSRENSIDSLSPGPSATGKHNAEERVALSRNTRDGGDDADIENGEDDQNDNDDDDDDDEEDEDVLGVTNAIIWLCVVSVVISFLSDSIVSTIEDAAKGTNLSNVFLAAIVVPIVGNAAEHTSAVIFGMRNRLNLALAIAVGSATQIGLFLLPVVVLLGWMAGMPMSLNYEGYEVVALTLAVVLVGFVLSKGRSTWLDGATLIGAYVVMCGGFWSHGSESDL